jgi:hypothetical protein
LMTPSSNSSNSREAKCSSGVTTSFIDVSNKKASCFNRAFEPFSGYNLSKS